MSVLVPVDANAIGRDTGGFAHVCEASERPASRVVRLPMPMGREVIVANQRIGENGGSGKHVPPARAVLLRARRVIEAGWVQGNSA